MILIVVVLFCTHADLVSLFFDGYTCRYLISGPIGHLIPWLKVMVCGTSSRVIKNHAPLAWPLGYAVYADKIRYMVYGILPTVFFISIVPVNCYG